jgi:type III secretion protein T
MEAWFQLESLKAIALTIGLSILRVTVAFILIPLFTQDTVPQLVRNSIFMAAAILVVVIIPPVDVTGWGTLQWLQLLSKEAFIGFIIGFFFGAVFWALQAAGEIIDNKVGMSQATLSDPLGGDSISLSAAVLTRLGQFILVAGGGLSLLIALILETYAIWPISAAWPDLSLLSVVYFEQQGARVAAIALAVAAPALVLMFAVDAVLGLLNRFAQQLDVFSLAPMIKGWAASLILLLILFPVIELLEKEISQAPGRVKAVIQQIMPPAR